MSVSKGLARLGRQKSAAPGLSLESADGWVPAGRRRELTADAAMKISAVSACVEIISNAIGMLPMYVMDSGSKARLGDPPWAVCCGSGPTRPCRPSSSFGWRSASGFCGATPTPGSTGTATGSRWSSSPCRRPPASRSSSRGPGGCGIWPRSPKAGACTSSARRISCISRPTPRTASRASPSSTGPGRPWRSPPRPSGTSRPSMRTAAGPAAY